MWNRSLKPLTFALAVPALAVALTGCSGTDGNNNGDSCEEPALRHSPSPFALEEAFPPSDDEPENRGDKTRTPYEATWHLRSECESEDVEVQKTCLIGEGEESGSGRTTEHFTIEGPEPGTVIAGQDSIVRLTYDRESPNGDDVDNAAMVFQTNASNLPTLVVPICARVIGESDGAEREFPTCESPIEVPAAGEKMEGLCSN